MIRVRAVRIGKAGKDTLLLHKGATTFRVTFADDYVMTKEDWARAFSFEEGKDAVIPEEGKFFIGTDLMPGDFESCQKAHLCFCPVASVVHI